MKEDLKIIAFALALYTGATVIGVAALYVLIKLLES